MKTPGRENVPARVLIFEDDVDIARQWQRGFEAAGIATVLAHTVDAAVEAVREETFSAVVLDMFVTDNDRGYAPEGGLNVLAEINRLAEPRPPVVMVSGAVNVTLVKTLGARLGAPTLLRKPATAEQLIAAVYEAVRNA